MKVTVSHDQDVTVAHVSGELDLATVGQLMAALRRAVPNSAMGLVLDLRDTEFLDSAGLGVLYDIDRRLGRREQELHVVVAPESFVGDVVTDTGFSSYVDVHTELAEAIGEVQALA